MLSDPDIEQAAAQLAQYRSSDSLSKILDQFAVLIDDYKRLKSDYEEERETREKYKQMAKDQERNPFVLVLVDGDGYVFNDTYIAKRAEGGGAAAQALNDAVITSLRRKGLEHCQVIARVYANVFGLSKALSKTGAVGADSRSLAPFIASFNRTYGLTEFVDAGQLKENADFKLRALLRLYADNAQCKHIYFAGCHDVGYISELTPFMSNCSRFTLVSSPGVRFHDEFRKLGMAIEEFRDVFRHAPLDGSVMRRHANFSAVTAKPNSAGTQPGSPTKKYYLAPAAANNDDNNKQKGVCVFYSKGSCRYGKSCKYLHANAPFDAAQQVSEPPSPSSSTTSSTGSTPSGSCSDRPALLADLLVEGEIPKGLMPLNREGHRLDPYLPPVPAEVMARLKARVDRRRVCNKLHLRGFCPAGDRCEYDHGPLEEDLLPALKTLARSQVCRRGGACRVEGCYKGHICQNVDCKHRGGRAYCRLPVSAHVQDLVEACLFPGDATRQGHRSVGRDSESDDSELSEDLD